MCLNSKTLKNLILPFSVLALTLLLIFAKF